MSGIEMYGAEDMDNVISMAYFSCSGEVFGNFQTEGNDFSYGIFDLGTFNTITFENCDFSNTSFEKSDLRYICFIECDFTNANFDTATLEECSFIHCGLSKSSFQSGTLVNCTLTECQGPIDLADAEIVGGVVFDSNLTSSSFYGTSIEGTVFGNTNLTDLLMSHVTSYRGVVLSGCDITGVYFVMADGGNTIEYRECIYKPYLSEAKLTYRKGDITSSTPKFNIYNGGNTNISYGWDRSAELYCSSMVEYREVV